jgi:hypothetical protein
LDELRRSWPLSLAVFAYLLSLVETAAAVIPYGARG